MNTEDNIQKEESTESVQSIIQKIRDGLLSIKNIDEEARLECINILRLEGYMTSQIAQVFKMSDRQIRRYMQKIKEINALNDDENFAKEFLGEIKQQVLNSFSHLMRLARNKETSPADKIQAEVAACNHLFKLAELLQSTGHLTLQPQMIGANIYHHVNNFTEQDILDIETAAKESIGLPDKVIKILTDLRAEVASPPEAEQKDKEKTNDTETTQ